MLLTITCVFLGNLFSIFVLSLLSCSVMSNSLWPYGLQHTRILSPSLISQSLLRFMSIELVIPSNHLILCCPLLLLPSISHSIRVFSNKSSRCIRWPKYWSFSFSLSPSNEFSELISFRIDCFDPLAVQGTLRSLLQHHSSRNGNSLQYSCLENPMDRGAWWPTV